VIPNSRIWSGVVANATSGQRSLLCVAEFHLHPEHDSAAVAAKLDEVAQSSSYRLEGKAVSVIVSEKPWGTKHRLKAYVRESRDQFRFMTDLTVRGREAIRALGIRHAQVPYAVAEGK